MSWILENCHWFSKKSLVFKMSQKPYSATFCRALIQMFPFPFPIQAYHGGRPAPMSSYSKEKRWYLAEVVGRGRRDWRSASRKRVKRWFEEHKPFNMVFFFFWVCGRCLCEFIRKNSASCSTINEIFSPLFIFLPFLPLAHLLAPLRIKTCAVSMYLPQAEMDPADQECISFYFHLFPVLFLFGWRRKSDGCSASPVINC